jgi:M6 family metalloprotease-like protein
MDCATDRATLSAWMPGRYAVLLTARVFTASVILAARALAAPGAPHDFTIAQPDGAEFAATTWGDERTSGVETADGYAIVLDTATGFWKYAQRDGSGALVPSERVVGRDAPDGLTRHLRPAAIGAGDGPGAPPAPGPAPGPGAPALPGPHRLLVLLVEFTPAQSRGTTEADWEALAFSGGIATAPDSLADYWNEVSYGQVTIVPAQETGGAVDNGVVEVTLGTAHPDTAGNDANRQLTSDALTAADPLVDYMAFDDDGNGYLDTNELHVLVVARGYERAYGGADVCTGAGSVWGHHWSLYGAVPAPTLDGVIVGDTFGGPAPGPRQGGYSQIGEWHCRSTDTPGHMATIGVAAHELGHDMGTGVPDLYDTDSSSSGIGRWALQAGGAWNTTGPHAGMTPAWPDAWSRWFLGFITPAQPPVCADDWAFPQIETAASAPARGVVRLRDNPAGVDWEWGGSGTGEYFLVENRQQVGFDAALPGAGLLIWHVAEAAPGDNSANAGEGTCPPGGLRLVALEQADGDFDLECFDTCGGACNNGDGGDPWAGGAFFGASTPGSDLYSGADTGVRVDDISASGATMTADLGYGPCSDGDACTSADLCVQGACAGAVYSCDDGDVCTDDACDGSGGCSFVDNTAPCVSTDPCAAPPKNGTCLNGLCMNLIIYDCFSFDPCIRSDCDGNGGCTETPITGGSCDDGDVCTSADACAAGTCAGAPYACDDGDVCTDDVCQGDGTCSFLDNTAPCDDGDACTSGDTCAAAACVGAPYACDDGNVCTTETCDGTGGCATFNADGFPCDYDPCLGISECRGGECVITIVIDCIPLDPCLYGTCDPVSGCVYEPALGASCDDGDPCTANDVCGVNGCFGEPMTCDDGNPCTDDTCGFAGCTNLTNTAPCDDGDACTRNDQCSFGVCGGERVDCDDHNACTDDTCAPGGCTHAPNADPCDDGRACTATDGCVDGVCTGVPYACDDGDPCTADLCDGDGTCTFLPQVVDCDDGDPCTEDSCDGKGGCIHAPLCGDGGVTAPPGQATPSDDGCGCAIGRARQSDAPWLFALAAWLAARRRAPETLSTLRRVRLAEPPGSHR